MPAKQQDPTFTQVLAYVKEATPLAYVRPLNIQPCRFLDENVAVLEEDLHRYYARLKILHTLIVKFAGFMFGSGLY